MRRCPQRGFCRASRRTRSRTSPRDGRAPRGTPIGPLVLDQAPVPGEQGAGCHDPGQPQGPGQQVRASAGRCRPTALTAAPRPSRATIATAASPAAATAGRRARSRRTADGAPSACRHGIRVDLARAILPADSILGERLGQLVNTRTRRRTKRRDALAERLANAMALRWNLRFVPRRLLNTGRQQA